MRIEKDSIGKVELPNEAVYGINSYRSFNNFPVSGERVNPHFIKAFLQVKLAAAETNYKCGLLFKEKYESIEDAIEKLISETEEAIANKSYGIYDKIIADPYQGGAGTSLNMCVNEVIANTSLKLMGKNYGEYDSIHPLDDVNMSQSTNDTFPTAFRIAAIVLIRELAEAFAKLHRSLKNKEVEFKNILKLARTQYQDAVPISLGQEFGAYAQIIARDQWRLSKSEERLRVVNLGGTAAGNSIAASKEYVQNVNEILRKITEIPIFKSEDLIDATQNLDSIVETHGIIKTSACSIIKICNDLRFMSSGPKGGIGEIKLPPMQAGSSIMPGKVNPVILEHAVQISELIKGHDATISNLCAAGNLELNAFLPMISHLYLKSVSLFKQTILSLVDNCIKDIKPDAEKCKSHLISSTAIAASLIPVYGYETIESIVKYSESEKIPFIKALMKSKIITEKELYNLLSSELGIELE